MTERHSSSAIRASGRSRVMPAEVTTADSGPSSASAAVTNSLTCAASATSTRRWRTRAPAFSAVRAASSAASASER